MHSRNWTCSSYCTHFLIPTEMLVWGSLMSFFLSSHKTGRSFLLGCVLTICSWCVIFSGLRANATMSPADAQSDLLLVLLWVIEEKFKLPIKSEDYLMENRNFIPHWRADLQKHHFCWLHWTALGNVTRAPELGNLWLSHGTKLVSSALFL